MKKKLYTGLVTANPPREVEGESIRSIVQELSSGNPTIQVPQGDSPLDERERALLLYDAALTPSDMPGAYGVESWALDTARIVRANQLAKDKLPAVNPSSLSSKDHEIIREVMQHYLDKGNYNQMKAAKIRLETLTGVMLMPTEMRQAIKEIDWRQWSHAVAFAKHLQAKATEQNERPQGPPPPKGNPSGEDGSIGFEEQPSDEWLDHNEQEGAEETDSPDTGNKSAEQKEKEQIEKSVMPNPETGRKPRLSRFVNADPWTPGKLPKPVSDPGRPGILENLDNVDILPMEPRRKKGVCHRRAELEGSNLVALDRLHLDGKIFKGAKVKGGSKGRGTVLVDMSGSMCWTPEMFAELLTVLPECSVYGYTGYGGGTKGRLVLLADRGRAARMDAVTQWLHDKGSNIIDDSCLRFLAKCPKPRLWISDGGVTGCYDKQTPYITALCNAAIVAGNITRVKNTKEAIKALTGKSY